MRGVRATCGASGRSRRTIGGALRAGRVRPPALALLALLAAWAPLDRAQAAPQQAWAVLRIQHPIDRRWSIGGDLTRRIGGGRLRPERVIARLNVAHAIGRRLTLAVGAGHTRIHGANGHDTTEEQAYGQASLDHGAIAGWALRSRTRIEARWQDGADATAWRARVQLRAEHSLGAGRTALFLIAEPMVNLNHTSLVRTTIDQLRLGGGVAIPLAKGLSGELGYTHIHQWRPEGDIGGGTTILALVWRG